jgi:hypothetical protein
MIGVRVLKRDAVERLIGIAPKSVVVGEFAKAGLKSQQKKAHSTASDKRISQKTISEMKLAWCVSEVDVSIHLPRANN